MHCFQRKLPLHFCSYRIRDIKSWQDWNTVTVSQISNNGGVTLLNLHGGSPLKLLRSVYPEHPWDGSNRNEKPKGYWDDKENQRKFMNELAIKLNIEHWHDWQKIKSQHILDNGGRTLLGRYNNSLFKVLESVFPEHPWKSNTHRIKMPHGYWNSTTNQRQFMDTIARKLKLSRWQDWASVTHKQIKDNGGARLLGMHNESPFKLLQSVYPEHPWQTIDHRIRVNTSPSKPNGFWNDVDNQRKFVDELAVKLNIKRLEDWGKIKVQQFQENGGATLIGKYNNSPFKLLQSIYPEQPWESVNHRAHVPRGYWNDKANQRKFMDKLGKQLNITKWSEWGMVSRLLIEEYGGRTLTSIYGSRRNLLQHIYPEHDWNRIFSTSFEITDASRKTQTHLYNLLKKLLPEHRAQFNFKYPDLLYELGGNIELDIFYPTLSIGFEYQGESHYYDSFIFTNSARRAEVDLMKKRRFPTEGITLISIPFWWDKREESLISTILSIRPDINLKAPRNGIPISEHIPPKIQQRIVNRTGAL